MKKNLLFVIPQLDVGGAETQLLNLVKGIDKSKFRIYVCNLSENQNKLEKEFKKLDINMVEIYKKSKYDIGIVFRLKKFIKDNNIDIVHSTLNNFWPRVASIMIYKRPILIASERSIDNWWKKKYHFLADNFLAKFTDVMVCNSVKIKEFYETKVPNLKDKIDVIYNGVLSEKFKTISEDEKHELKKQYKIDDDDIVFGIVAGLRDVKDHMTLLKAVNLLKNYNQNFKLLIIGDGKNRDKINEYIKENNLTNYIKMIGETSDVYKFLNIIDIGIICSIQEGLSNSIIEYMLCKSPVIATNVGGNVELVKDNERGFLVNVGDFEELSNKMLFFIKNKEIIKSYGENSYKYAYENFKYENMIESYENLYEKLIDFRKNG